MTPQPDDSASDVVRLTDELIRVASTADRPENLDKVLDVAAKYLEDLPQVLIRRLQDGDKPLLIASLDESLTPDVLLLGHLDVVPGDAAQYEPQEKDGKIYGRGACDMKSGAAALIWLFRKYALRKDGPSLVLALTTDEEKGGAHGARHLAEDLGYRPKLAIVPDGGNGPDDVIVENKGVLQLNITALGKSSHGSRPWEGKNPNDDLLPALQRVCALFPPASKERWGDTCAVTTLNSGTSINQIPDAAQATLDIRLTAQTDPDELLERIKAQATPCHVEIRMQGKASSTPSGNPLLQAFPPLVKLVFGLDVKFNRTPGGNDGRFFAALGVPLLIVRPPSGDLHGPDEWVDKAGLIKYAQLLSSYIQTITPLLKDMP